EWISGLLALQCELPVLPMAVVRHPRCLATGWLYVPPERWIDVPSSPRVLDALANPGALYGMAVFDALIRNTDRHGGNIIVLKDERPPFRPRLLVHDHDHALICPGLTPTSLEAPELDAPELWMRHPELRRRIASRTRLLETAADVQHLLADEVIEAIVE